MLYVIKCNYCNVLQYTSYDVKDNSVLCENSLCNKWIVVKDNILKMYNNMIFYDLTS